jgi:hypothetical protein
VHPDRHDPPGLIDKLVPCVAAVVDDAVEGFEDPVRKPIAAHELCQTFSCGLSSGHLAGNAISVTFGGTMSRPDTCQLPGDMFSLRRNPSRPWRVFVGIAKI